MKHWRLGYRISSLQSVRISTPNESLPYWQIRAHHRPLIKTARRRDLIDHAAEELRPWKFNPWEGEGQVVTDLRRNILDLGYGFDKADAEAYDIVRLAFVQLGRGIEKRPSWDEGQPEATIPRENCQRCGGPLSEEQIEDGESYCSPACRDSAKRYRAEHHSRLNHLAYQRKWTAENLRSEELQTCPQCGGEFHPLKRGQTYCSNACTRRAQAKLGERQCDACGTTFRPKDSKQRYCSEKCRLEGMKHAEYDERPCEECGKPFRPKHPRGRFCSPQCKDNARNRQAKAERAIVLEKHCAHCGEPFTTTSKQQKFCGPECRDKHAVDRERDKRHKAKVS